LRRDIADTTSPHPQAVHGPSSCNADGGIPGLPFPRNTGKRRRHVQWLSSLMLPNKWAMDGCQPV